MGQDMDDLTTFISPAHGDSFSDILGDIDDHISSPLTGMLSKKTFKVTSVSWGQELAVPLHWRGGCRLVLDFTLPVIKLGSMKAFNKLS